eukprot:4649888-Pyramimonas_sp.AAC.1
MEMGEIHAVCVRAESEEGERHPYLCPSPVCPSFCGPPGRAPSPPLRTRPEIRVRTHPGEIR